MFCYGSHQVIILMQILISDTHVQLNIAYYLALPYKSAMHIAVDNLIILKNLKRSHTRVFVYQVCLAFRTSLGLNPLVPKL